MLKNKQAPGDLTVKPGSHMPLTYLLPVLHWILFPQMRTYATSNKDHCRSEMVASGRQEKLHNIAQYYVGKGTFREPTQWRGQKMEVKWHSDPLAPSPTLQPYFEGRIKLHKGFYRLNCQKQKKIRKNYMRKKNNNSASQTSLSSIILLSSSITLLCTNACQIKKVYINCIVHL